MRVPGYTAEASLYRSGRAFRRAARTGPDGGVVVPAERSCSPTLDCPNLPDGEYPNPETCTAFCYCTHGRSVWTNCPSGLHFNPRLKVCDWPYNAGCVEPARATT